jgi:hypothetical protein
MDRRKHGNTFVKLGVERNAAPVRAQNVYASSTDSLMAGSEMGHSSVILSPHSLPLHDDYEQ